MMLGVVDHELPEEHVIFVEGQSMSVSEAKSQLFQQLVAPYFADLEKSRAAAFEEVVCITILTNDLGHEADWGFADFTADPDLGIRAWIFGGYGRLPDRAWC